MLAGRLILDLSYNLPGPYATQLLADLGARVIKVEAPRGDPVRHMPPFDATGLSTAFAALNHNKESLALDLKLPGGRDLLLRLVEQADALLDGFRPGVLERLGLGPEACQARNPRLVYCALTGYGLDGPYRERAGHDLDYQAYAGALSITASRDGSLAIPGLQPGDLLGSYAGLVGILAALLEAERTGRGRLVDAAMLDALVSAQGLHFMNHRAGMRAAPAGMPLNGGIPCYGLYATAEGEHVALGALEPKFWQVFCDIVGREDWIARQYDPSLCADVAALFATRPRDEWRVILENAECCLAPVLAYDEVPADPQVTARELFRPARAGPPLRFRPPLPPRDEPPPARPGMHGRALLGELLGLDDAAINALAQTGVLSLPEEG